MFMKQEEQYKKDKINAAREGGKGRAKSYEQLKAKVVELLNKHVPEGRWKTKTAAIDALQNDITQFIEDENIKISWHRAITDWSRNDNVIKAAFDKVVKKK
ncbi:Uncharacterised protein [Serratia fonticola]|nr:Uncharacterised protein [Serratia fonticola]